MYVCHIDATGNRVILGGNQNVFRSSLVCSNINFMGAEKFVDGQQVYAKIRYGAKEKKGFLTHISQDVIKCEFENKVRAVTPGQAVVFYDGNVCLGGGYILE